MAGLAFVAAASFVRIVGRMTAVAGFRRILKDLGFMAAEALGVRMLADEAETGRFVVKTDIEPVGFGVTIRTFCAEAFLVDVIFQVTGNALAGCIAMPFIGFVAVHAGGFGVFPE